MTQTQEKTGLGNYFVANYPPFSAWKPDYVPAAHKALQGPPQPGTPLGLYLHIPFCRKRCKFCYFRVYTDKNARDVDVYLDALIREVELYAQTAVVGGRPLQFVYFGGGTPSYLSSAQLRGLFERVQAVFPWTNADEVTFECEPGTLQRHKLETLRELGVTRLSLGIENFDDKILESNGRAHLSAEIFRSYGWARELEFPQINIDLIAGMVGETWNNWKECVQKTIELAPDSVTVYQMELPFNTVFSKELHVVGQNTVDPDHVADWPTKRAWVDYAFLEMAKAGYSVSSAYTVVKDKARTKFVYRDSLWSGADMFGTGVASFGHVSGVHMQNVDSWGEYVAGLQGGSLPLHRALPVSKHQRLLREMMLQLKTGRLQAGYFQSKFGADILTEFGDGFRRLSDEGFATVQDDAVALTRPGLLQVDRLLPDFFEPAYRGGRYT
ncbi:MAG: coproporphyrinogen III oxidase family protein [Gemmataceae bacterium]|nr:coproporphyrinogen III oxidase family protein [Gemmataceae bacterium]MCI0742116.1 coproporphyrinogen III oxidase family protein [Gemmataceae bacterium]